jgi:peptidyl-prolyl cis-trans isomerase C
MVEQFATAAFALKPYEMSGPVKTQFGYHLILCTGRMPGKSVKFEEVKEEVREAYCNQLRDAVVNRYRPAAKIVIAK